MNHHSWRGLLSATVWWLCLFVLPSYAGQAFDRTEHQLVVVTADEGDATTSIVATLRKTFPAARFTGASQVRHLPQERPVYVAVGPAALRSLLARRLEAPIVSVFVSRRTYEDVLKETGAVASPITAIYPEPSPLDQLRLVAAIYQKRVSVGVIAGENSADLLPELKRQAANFDVDLIMENLAPQETINRALDRVANAPVLLALPDATVYSPENIRNILITTYRRNQAVIGFSVPFVKAGALASTVSGIPEITAQLEELLDEFARKGRMPAPQYPRYFDVVVNEGVARSLNLVVDETVKRSARNPARGVQP